MKNKKQIDKLFQERFQNFDATPPPEVWATIEAQLRKDKRDRKVIPLWWKVAGVAALLALLFTIGNSVFDFGDSSTELTEENSILPENNDAVKTTPIISEEKINATDIATENDTDKTENIEDNKKVLSNDKSKEALFSVKNSTKNSIANENTSNKKKTASNKDLIIKDKDIITSVKEKDAVAVANDKNISEKTTSDKIAVTEMATDSELKKTNTASDPIINKEKEILETIKTEAVATNVNKTEITEEKKGVEENKKSIFDAIEEGKTEEAVVKNDAPDNRWEIFPNVGPVYYSSFGNGSSIDPSFADNSQSGDINFSYGAGISYAITDRLSIRSGISNVNLSYTTGGVELGTGPVSAALKSVDYGGRQIVVTAVDKGTLQSDNPENGGPFGDIILKSGGGDAFIKQSIRYYEVPMELKYTLLNKRFGINMIGGFSTLFLGSSEVSVNAGDFSTVLGEANNLNSLSFTTNIGLGFDYKISKRLKFNIEPIFKYQLNPYSDSSVDFNPFYMGIYTGLSFKF